MMVFDKTKNLFYSTKITDDIYFAGFGTKAMEKVPFTNWLVNEQTHSTIVKNVTDNNRNIVEEGDGLFTVLTDQALVIKTADCVPIIFVDKKQQIIGISHQGWKGTYNLLQQKLIGQFVTNGSDKKNIIVAIGPCIGSCCYSISEERKELFQNKFPSLAKEIFTQLEGKIFLNLLRLNYLLLLQAGIEKDSIDYFPFCTQCDENHFFSYRRDYHTNKKQFGHMLSFVVKHKN